MIEIKNLKKTFKNNIVLKDVSLTINEGELVVFIGPSGCGKTTTLKMINKLIMPTSGEILIDGKNIINEDTISLRRKMGYVIQQTGLFPHMTVKENISLIADLQKWDKDKITIKVSELLKLVGLNKEEYIDKYPSELSGGQQQRIGIARAFMMNPEIILMDEPFSALDPITRNQLQDEVYNIQQELKKTIVFVTHDMDEALKLADRICIMKDGLVVQFDTPENILKHPADDFVKEFIGKDRIWNQPELIKVKDIMIKNPIKAVEERTSLQAIQIMRSNHVDSLLIVDGDEKLNGLVTLKDIRKTLEKNTKLKDIMERNIITVSSDDSIINVLEKMEKESIGYVPVINENSKLVGLITRSSLLSVLSNQFLDKEVLLHE
ncbi:ABC transporter ATP-binding protein [Clostridiaceae bacterium UIB06]|uniref:Quaternary amine transport ATP-binding protein n=1 Tax=Clostridium thailandense TaxID=2794346 RepID=A0A949U541_9CLOT|nr:betaine/proline/choline family ABC transporter ATP-binding protein [Clostridium thailandense]MBV7276658.1 ABC transporter ATP-binding protein [Clostridium thailandense]MCH5138701.1 ABC transporter ATP-binding protein [Clostridiaceae bacterium UIB06]